MSIRVTDTVQVLEAKRVAPFWYGKTGRVINIVGELLPFAYVVKMDSCSRELVFRGDEIKTIKHNLS